MNRFRLILIEYIMIGLDLFCKVLRGAAGNEIRL